MREEVVNRFVLYPHTQVYSVLLIILQHCSKHSEGTCGCVCLNWHSLVGRNTRWRFARFLRSSLFPESFTKMNSWLQVQTKTSPTEGWYFVLLVMKKWKKIKNYHSTLLLQIHYMKWRCHPEIYFYVRLSTRRETDLNERDEKRNIHISNANLRN